MSDVPDDTLVREARAGDEAARQTLVDRSRSRLFAYVASMTGDALLAEDVLQDSYQRMFERLDELRDVARWRSWLFSIAIHRCRTLLRTRARRREVQRDGGDEMVEVRRSALSSLVRRESADLLALAIDRLPILLREAFVLRHVEGLDYREIAELTAVTASTLQVRVHRAKALLRRQLGPSVESHWRH